MCVCGRMVIEGIGMNASSSEATPLTRHAFQRSHVALGLNGGDGKMPREKAPRR